MVHTTINILDLIVFAVLGLSALLSFFRGFVREVLSLGAWVGATIITLYAFPHVAALLKPHVGSTMVASGFAALFTFMGALIIISIFNGLLLKFLKTGSDVGVLDNGLGLIFGLARGALLIAVVYFLFSLSTDKSQHPEWFEGSVSLPYVERAATWVAEVAPDYLKEVSEGDKNVDNAVEDAVDDAKDNIDDSTTDMNVDWPTLDDLKQRMQKVTE